MIEADSDDAIMDIRRLKSRNTFPSVTALVSSMGSYSKIPIYINAT